ncbi:hypothetical protein NWI01_35270 [Nitrobacter winogradskyi]|uniref:Uncharacterized protein n=1 Tax=Nitrobacter winogradskyi TaxID=913 RepID=A0A4Y3WG14_NITWI|nr:hypothetical protein NWI01_35270 [Nitrobacter winogradskyi]
MKETRATTVIKNPSLVTGETFGANTPCKGQPLHERKIPFAGNVKFKLWSGTSLPTIGQPKCLAMASPLRT